MQLTMIESPYAGDSDKFIAYARRCMKDSLDRGQTPFASHLLYTQEGILDDKIETDRRKGICCGFDWGRCADKIVFYMDFGMSPGMVAALMYYTKLRTEDLARRDYVTIDFRYIGKKEEEVNEKQYTT